MSNTPSDRKAIVLLSSLGGFIGALCCLTPIVLVLLGLASVSVAASLGNRLYGDYKWEFRLVALVFMVVALVLYFRRRGICTLDDVKRQRNRVVNVTVLVLLAAVWVYIFGNYVVLHYWGMAAGLPLAQYDESWAIPASAVVLAALLVASFVIRKLNSGRS